MGICTQKKLNSCKGFARNGDDSCKFVIFQIVQLVLNVVLVITIFVVAVRWSVVRRCPMKDSDMIPAPYMDRASLCTKTDPKDNTCQNRVKPEDYIADEVEKNMKRLQMQYMAEKLKYANVVCRTKMPFVYILHGIEPTIRGAHESIKWRTTDIVKTADQPVKYDSASGQFKITKEGLYFIYSQIMEKALNLVNNGTSLQIKVQSNKQQTTIMASDSAPCILVSSEGRRAHYVGSAISLKVDDVVSAFHSHPGDIINNNDTFIGIRQLWEEKL